jgi:hypothetical protein
MNTQVNRTPLAISAWLHLQRAREAVNMAAAELPRTQLSPQARQQYALELAELMGKVELLLSMLRRQASNDPRVRRRTSKRLASGFRLGLAKACAFTLKSASELGGLGLLKVSRTSRSLRLGDARSPCRGRGSLLRQKRACRAQAGNR